MSALYSVKPVIIQNDNIYVLNSALMVADLDLKIQKIWIKILSSFVSREWKNPVCLLMDKKTEEFCRPDSGLVQSEPQLWALRGAQIIVMTEHISRRTLRSARSHITSTHL